MAEERGRHVAHDDAPLRRAGKARRLYKVLFAQRQKAPAHYPRQPGPANQRKDDCDGEINPRHRPILGNRRTQSQPKRDAGHGANKLDNALDRDVGRAAVVAGDSTNQNAQNEADDHPDQPDRGGDPCSRQQAGQHVATQPVRA